MVVGRQVTLPTFIFAMPHRCAAPNGTIGTAYPASFSQCLGFLASSNDKELAIHYGLSDRLRPHLLRTRAQDMLTVGFEGTVKVRSCTRVPMKRHGGGKTDYRCPAAPVPTCTNNIKVNLATTKSRHSVSMRAHVAIGEKGSVRIALSDEHQAPFTIFRVAAKR
eukprot:366468-Chlamydomonas_euryale.AAC.11